MAKLKILLVDDEPDILKVMGARIESWGYELATALSAKDALVAIKDNKPDIAILDYMLSGMDGVELLKEIRLFNSDLPVIMFTAYPEPKAMEGTEKLGVKAFVPKLSSYSDASENLKSALDMIKRELRKGE